MTEGFVYKSVIISLEEDCVNTSECYMLVYRRNCACDQQQECLANTIARYELLLRRESESELSGCIICRM